jgi:K+-transporting ATPase KdpF subunit
VLGLRPALRADVAMFDLVLGGIVTACLLVYLVTAMVRPDKF